MLHFKRIKNRFIRFWLNLLVYSSVASVVWMLLGFAGLDQLGNGNIWLSMLCLLFIIAWLCMIAAIIGAFVSLLKRLVCKIRTKLNNKKDKGYEVMSQEDKTLEIIAEFKGFDDWISSVSAIKYILSVMQYPVGCAAKQGYTLNEVSVWGGVQEIDLGYEVFSRREYASFEDAVAKLPSEFKSEQKKLRKANKCSRLNFEGLTVVFVKDGAVSELTFRSGRLYADEGIGLYFQ